MNQGLIKELFSKATFDQTRLVDGVYYPYIPLQYGTETMRFSITEEQYQRFAEMIVQECLEILSEFGDNVENGDIFRSEDYSELLTHIKNGHLGPLLWRANELIKQHFGIDSGAKLPCIAVK